LQNDSCKQKKILKVVLYINLTMFSIELFAAIYAQSSSLLADACDMLGDAIVYALTLWSLNRTPKWIGLTSFIKGALIATFSACILLHVCFEWLHGTLPKGNIMIIFGMLGLVANGTCLYLLTEFKSRDLNMNSAWICAFNDVVTNLLVIIASVAVLTTQSLMPDIIVGLLLTVLLMKSAIGIIHRSWQQLQVPSKLLDADTLKNDKFLSQG
jgi:Co/Zn/Cd efflux system component